MRHNIMFVCVLAALASLMSGCKQYTSENNSAARTVAGSVAKDFVSNGDARLTLESGDFDIKPSPDNRIHVQWDEARGKEARITATVNGQSAEVKAENTPNNFHVTIELPAATNLRIRLGAGELRIGAFTGNEDIDNKAGNVTVSTGKTSDWAQVDVSLTAGDLKAPDFQVDKGGLNPSLHWSGPGKRRLNISVTAGNVKLQS